MLVNQSEKKRTKYFFIIQLVHTSLDSSKEMKQLNVSVSKVRWWWMVGVQH